MTTSPTTTTQTSDRPSGLGPGVIVDGYGTGNFLVDAFRSSGTDLIHVQSSTEPITRMVQPHKTKYVEALTYNQGETERILADLEVSFVIPGQEPGVNLADHLSEALGLRTNGTRLSTARRDKYQMTTTVAEAGLRTARQALVSDPAEAVRWANSTGGWPCVAKPLASASTDSVSICSTPEELEAAVREVLSSRTVFNFDNDQVLLQSYLRGTEYIVDTVSLDGATFVCGVWEYEKSLLPNGKPIYNRDILLDSGDHAARVVIDYTLSVLETLGIRNGPAHAEIMLTADGPALIEIGARTNGNMQPRFHDECLGTNAAQLTALAYRRPDQFVSEYAGRTYVRSQPAVVYNVPTARSGRIAAVNTDVVEAISERPSVVDLTVKRHSGDDLVPTQDLLSSPARIFMTAADKSTLDADYEFIDSVREEIYLLEDV